MHWQWQHRHCQLLKHSLKVWLKHRHKLCITVFGVLVLCPLSSTGMLESSASIPSRQKVLPCVACTVRQELSTAARSGGCNWHQKVTCCSMPHSGGQQVWGLSLSHRHFCVSRQYVGAYKGCREWCMQQHPRAGQVHSVSVPTLGRAGCIRYQQGIRLPQLQLLLNLALRQGWGRRGGFVRGGSSWNVLACMLFEQVSAKWGRARALSASIAALQSHPCTTKTWQVVAT